MRTLRTIILFIPTLIVTLLAIALTHMMLGKEGTDSVLRNFLRNTKPGPATFMGRVASASRDNSDEPQRRW